MASGGPIPFQLRPNKHVERLLFMELLSYVDRAFHLGDGAYMSMGGHALEDHRLFHERFGSTHLLSFDSDWAAVTRQKFNRPYSFIKCEEMSSSQFVNDFGTIASNSGSAGPFVVWLDYTSPAARHSQLRELQDLVSRMASGDVVKVTLNAAPHSLAQREDRPHSDGRIVKGWRREAATLLHHQLDDYAPQESFRPEQMNASGLAEILLEAVRLASAAGIADVPSLSVWPLASFRYTDAAHQMLTVTLLVGDNEDWHTLERTGFSDWQFASGGRPGPTLIKLPVLTIKEQLRIAEEVMVNDPAQIVANLPFQLEQDSDESTRQIEEYVLHYLRYPTFATVNV